MSASCSSGTWAIPRTELHGPVAAPVVGVDLGGTKIFAARVDPRASGLEAVEADFKCETPTSGVAGIVDAIEAGVRRLDENPSSIGIGCPGVIDPATGRVRYAPNLVGFDHPVDLAALVADRFGCGVTIGNDVNVAALGEARFGAARGIDDVLAVWMGTGLGAGLVLDGRLRVGPSGLAGELGHTVVVPGGERCPCGGAGHLEAYIGRRALETRVLAAHAAGRATMLADLDRSGPMKSKVIRRAYDRGDELTRELIDEGLALLGLAIANVAVVVDVSAIVIGGGLGERFADITIDRLSATLDALRFVSAPPTVVPAALGEHAGALGAAVLATEVTGRG